MNNYLEHITSIRDNLSIIIQELNREIESGAFIPSPEQEILIGQMAERGRNLNVQIAEMKKDIESLRKSRG